MGSVPLKRRLILGETEGGMSDGRVSPPTPAPLLRACPAGVTRGLTWVTQPDRRLRAPEAARPQSDRPRAQQAPHATHSAYTHKPQPEKTPSCTHRPADTHHRPGELQQDTDTASLPPPPNPCQGDPARKPPTTRHCSPQPHTQ